jgi:hypothetical protein
VKHFIKASKWLVRKIIIAKADYSPSPQGASPILMMLNNLFSKQKKTAGVLSVEYIRSSGLFTRQKKPRLKGIKVGAN